MGSLLRRLAKFGPPPLIVKWQNLGTLPQKPPPIMFSEQSLTPVNTTPPLFMFHLPTIPKCCFLFLKALFREVQKHGWDYTLQL